MFKTPMVWQVTIDDLHSIWDYEDKLECKRCSKPHRNMMLSYRICSQLAKMIRVFLTKAADVIVDTVMGTMSQPFPEVSVLGSMVGFSNDVPLLPLEANVTTWVAATQADDSEVDLSIWALPNETIEQSKAREVLRQFVDRWWAYNLSKKA